MVAELYFDTHLYIVESTDTTYIWADLYYKKIVPVLVKQDFISFRSHNAIHLRAWQIL